MAEITITQQRKAAVTAARAQGFQVYDGTRGNASFAAYPPAIHALIEHLETIRREKQPVAYGQSPLGEPDILEQARKGIENHYPYEQLSTARIALFPGAQFGLIATLAALLKKKDHGTVLVQWPGYPNYEKLFDQAKKLASTPHAQFGHIEVGSKGYATADNLRKSIETAKATGQPISAIILTIPSNPQGKIPPLEEQKAIVRLSEEFPTIPIIIDEAFIEIDFRKQHENRFKSITHVAKEMRAMAFLDRTTIVRSGTKAAAMAGFRPNLIILPDDKAIVDSVKATAATFLGNTGLAEQILMAQWIHSLSTPEQAAISDHYAANLAFLTASLDKLGVPYTLPDGGFFMMIDAKELLGTALPPDMARTLGKPKLETDGDIFDLFLKTGHQNGKEKLGVMPGSDFGYTPTEGKVRFCFGSDRNQIIGAANVITNIYNRIREYNRDKKPFEPVAEQPQKPARKSLSQYVYATAAAAVLATGLGIGTITRQNSIKPHPASWSSKSDLSSFTGVDFHNEHKMRETFGDTVEINGIKVDMGIFVNTVTPLLKQLDAEKLFVTGNKEAPDPRTYIFVDGAISSAAPEANTSLGNYVELVRKSPTPRGKNG